MNLYGPSARVSLRLPEQAQDMHASIRGWLTEAFGAEVAESIPVLYGNLASQAMPQSCFPKKTSTVVSLEGLP